MIMVVKAVHRMFASLVLLDFISTKISVINVPRIFLIVNHVAVLKFALAAIIHNTHLI